jgi:mono/diheme cytochrome c family protein
MNRILTAVLLGALVGFAGTAYAQEAAATYKAKCVACHGADGKKKGDLTAAKGSEADVAKAIANGIPEKKMPGYKGKLSDAEIQALAKFVKGGLK